MGGADEPVDYLARWIGWVDEIRNNLIAVHHHRQMWESLNEAIAQRASETPATWRNHYLRLYVDSQAMAIRRIIRSAPGQDSITLGRLLERITEHPEVVNRQNYRERWLSTVPGAMALDVPGREFDANWSDGSGNIDLAKIHKDKADLNAVANKVILFADHFVAHIVDGQPDSGLTLGELNEAIDHTGAIFVRWALLVTGIDNELTPTVIDPWQTTFDRPLFPPDGNWL